MPGTSLKPYDPLFAATQRARNPVAAAGKGVGAGGFKAPWFDPLVPVAHGAKDVVIPALVGAGIGGVLSDDKNRTENMARLATSGALLGLPAGVLDGMFVRHQRDILRKGLQENAVFGQNAVKDFARRAHPYAPNAPTAEHLRSYANQDAMSDVQNTIPYFRQQKAQAERAFRQALKSSDLPSGDSSLIRELKNEYPGLSDRQIAGKLHPDQRGHTEAPSESLDEAYRDLIGRRRGAPVSAGDESYEGIAQDIRQKSQAAAKDFLRSWGGFPSELQGKF